MPHRRNIDIDLLRSFITIIEVKSFTRAAERLLRTQSAISLQMKRLEEQLGCRLFERGGRGVEPTDAGTLLLGFARRILAANDELVGRMAEPLVEGRAAIGAPEGFAFEHLAPVMARFGRAFPRTEVQVRTGPPAELSAGMERGELDLVICTSVGDTPEGELLMRETLLWCVAEGAEPDVLDGGGVRRVSLVSSRQPCPLREKVEDVLDKAGISHRLVFEAGSRAGVQAAVGAGLGIAVLPKGSLLPGMHRLSNAAGLPALPDLSTTLMTGRDPSPVAQRLRGFLLSVFDHRA